MLFLWVWGGKPLFAELSSIEHNIKQRQQEIQYLKNERRDVRKLIAKAKKNEWGVTEVLKYLNFNIKAKKDALVELQQKVEETRSAIHQGKAGLVRLQRRINVDQERLEQQIKALFYLEKVRKMTVLPGVDSLKHYFRNQRILQKATEFDLQLLSRLHANRNLAEESQRNLDRQSIKLKGLMRAEEEQKELLRFEKDQQVTYLRYLQKDQKSGLNKLQKIQVQVENLNDMVYSLEQEKEESRRQKTFRGFYKQKKNLPSPVSGTLKRTFGKSGSLYNNLFKRGVLVATPEDQLVVSILEGKVGFSGPFRGYETLVIIDHGKGSFSVYGNLEEVYVQKGDLVNQGTEIGVVAYNSQKESYLFYFETRYNRRPVNPLRWLKKPYWNKNDND